MYLDSTDPYYFHYDSLSEPTFKQKPKPTKKDDGIITKKILVIFGIVAIVKIAVLMLWI